IKLARRCTKLAVEYKFAVALFNVKSIALVMRDPLDVAGAFRSRRGNVRIEPKHLLTPPRPNNFTTVTESYALPAILRPFGKHGRHDLIAVSHPDQQSPILISCIVHFPFNIRLDDDKAVAILTRLRLLAVVEIELTGHRAEIWIDLKPSTVE